MVIHLFIYTWIVTKKLHQDKDVKHIDRKLQTAPRSFYLFINKFDNNVYFYNINIQPILKRKNKNRKKPKKQIREVYFFIFIFFSILETQQLLTDYNSGLHGLNEEHRWQQSAARETMGRSWWSSGRQDQNRKKTSRERQRMTDFQNKTGTNHSSWHENYYRCDRKFCCFCFVF